MRLALVEQTADGEVSYHLQSGPENLFDDMGALKKAMRSNPERWAAGKNWTLVEERPVWTVTPHTTYGIKEVDMGD